MYRINELVRAVKAWQKATVLEYASSSHPWRSPWFDGKARNDLRHGGKKLRYGRLPLLERSDAAYRDHSTEGKCRLDYAISLMSSSLTGLRRVSPWASKLTREMEKAAWAVNFTL